MLSASRMVRLLISSVILLGATGLGCSSSAQRMSVKITKRPQVLKETQPALAVRGVGCLMCHATVKSNIITDFGHGDSYFLGNNFAGPVAPFYGNLGVQRVPSDPTSPWTLPWQSAEIQGKVLVPKVTLSPGEHRTIREHSFIEFPESFTLRSFLSRTPFAADLRSLGLDVIQSSTSPMIPATKLEERTQIRIRAPSEDEIQTLNLPKSNALTFAGFVEYSDYIRAQGSVTCRGAHKLEKPLLLDHVILNTGPEGCRIYVSKSVFVQGAIKYSGTHPGEHLQLSSARGIYMGFDVGSLFNRISQNEFSSWAYTRSTPPLLNDPTQKADRTQFLLSLHDDVIPVVPYLVDAATETPRPEVNFEHVVFNAPQWHSRYRGNVKGTIIAEIALGEVGNFHFEYDPLFDNDNFELFPELAEGQGGPVLEVRD